MGCPLGFAPEAALEGLGLPLGGPGVEVVQLLGLQGFWQHQVLSWRLGQQEIQCSRRVWQPVLAHTLQYSCLEKPPDREAWQAIVYRVAKSWTGPKWPCARRCKIFFFFCLWQLSPVWVAREGGAAAWLAGTLAAPSVQGHRLPLRQELCPSQGLVFRASCSWRWEGLFGRSFSVAPPVQGSLAWGPSLLFSLSGT